jgi:cellulose synthase/poly-beta-1,6-N-acetylglucosamine synthase-like glycosyltransferase
MLIAVITIVIGTLAVINLIRMVAYLVGADVYTIRKARSKDRVLPAYRPSVSIVVPMHNEGPIVERTLEHLLKVDYEPLQIIVVDDGSTDDTADRIIAWKLAHKRGGILEAFTKTNGGKADAMNAAIRTRATGELIMCLDGDSILAPDAVEKSVAYFRDERVVATASNVNIMSGGGLLGLVQRYEYLISYHMKKAHNIFNVEYIIGGIGSMFRRKTLDEVDLYDTNTMTEDIDLTMKIIARKGNRNQRVAYAHDAITYTEAVPSFRSLVRQRYRWKYGRMQSFLKYGRLFFSLKKKHTLGLSWFMLPYALLQEVLYLIEPIILATIVGVSVYYRSPWTLVTVMVIISVYVIVNILGTVHLSRKDKLVLSLLSPLMYVFFYLLSVVEYIALMQSVIRLPKLRKSISEEKVTWKSPERVAA